MTIIAHDPLVTAILTITGLVLNAAGVLLLFYYGMPYRIRTEGKTGQTFFTGERKELENAEHKYDMLGRAGLWLILAGTVLQGYATMAVALG